ncbi:MAG: hypothetical protein RQ756_07215, partial [Flavobacteriaceae bacterium]|nr:hypothetical protein [Flavobacteriaceae bacterium]
MQIIKTFCLLVLPFVAISCMTKPKNENTIEAQVEKLSQVFKNSKKWEELPKTSSLEINLQETRAVFLKNNSDSSFDEVLVNNLKRQNYQLFL